MTINDLQKRSYAEEGYMIVPGFLDPDELGLVQEICDACIAKIEKDMRSRGVTEDRINLLGKKYFISNPRKTHPALNKVIFSEKAITVCKATIGDTAYLHNEQFVVKMTDTATSFAWHQDSGYSVYQGGAARHKPYVTFWIALDDMHHENGTISVLPFSRAPKPGLLEHTWETEQNAMGGFHGDDPGELVIVKAGTLVAFSSFLLHKSGANTTDKPRRSYFIAFTPELFTFKDPSKGIYSSGEVLVVDGQHSLA